MTVAHSWQQVSRMPWGGRGEGRGSQAEADGPRLYPEGRKEPQILFLFTFHLQGGKKR